jgi:hypothetical protein
VEVRRIPRIILRGDTERASYRAREGMRQLNILKELMGFQKLEQDVRRIQYIDKSEIICKSVFNEDIIEIYVPKEEKEIVSRKPVILTAISTYGHPSPPLPGISPYIDYYTYPFRVMLYDVEDEEVIETSMTTVELRERHGINVWHRDKYGRLTAQGLRLPDDMTHEKSYPLSRYLMHVMGLVGTGSSPIIFVHGAQAYSAVAWTADVLSEPPIPNYPDVPYSCTGECWWNGVTYGDTNINTTVVDTKESVEDEILNSRSQSVLKRQNDLVMCNARKIPGIGVCPSETTSSFAAADPLILYGRFSWLCEISAAGPAEHILSNYPRFSGSFRLTTRDTFPSIIAGSVGYVQSIFKDYQYQASHLLGGGTWGGGGDCPVPCPDDMYTVERVLTATAKCSFGELYETQFSHGTFSKWDCHAVGTQGCSGDDFEFPVTQHTFIGIEAGISDNKVISVVNIMAATERIAQPWVGTYSQPGQWSEDDAYPQPKVQKVKAGVNVTELDMELPYIDRILSANDIDYFSLPLEEGSVFELAVQGLVDEYYKRNPETFDYYVSPVLCIESRVLEQYIEREIPSGKYTVRYSSCSSPNPWITPKMDEPFWRPL